MFEDLLKEINRLDKNEIKIPIEVDEKGFIDRECPNKDCLFLFKVKHTSWEKIEKKISAWCPNCGHKAKSNQWFTNDHIKHATKEAKRYIVGRLQNSLKSSVNKFNRKQPKNSLIRMSQKIHGSNKSTFILPAISQEAMQLEITCEKCDCCFAVIGCAYFCPSCGFNSVERMFESSLRKIEVKRDFTKDKMIKSGGKDEAELIYRSLIETCITDGVCAFQKYCECLYEPYGGFPFNSFQSLKKSSELWKKAINIGYDDILLKNELYDLNILYEKRHLLSHKDGIVDEKYINKSGDKSYKIGQRIVISINDVDNFLYLLRKLRSKILKKFDEQ